MGLGIRRLSTHCNGWARAPQRRAATAGKTANALGAHVYRRLSVRHIWGGGGLSCAYLTDGATRRPDSPTSRRRCRFAHAARAIRREKSPRSPIEYGPSLRRRRLWATPLIFNDLNAPAHTAKRTADRCALCNRRRRPIWNFLANEKLRAGGTSRIMRYPAAARAPLRFRTAGVFTPEIRLPRSELGWLYTCL